MNPVLAHSGLSERQDLPIPLILFVWGAALVLALSFVALAALWREPRLERPGWRPLPLGLGRALASRPVEIVCGAVGLALLALVVYAGLRGEQVPDANIAPTLVFVIFWVGLVPLSVLFGDVFRAFNPWRAAGRAVGWVARTAARTEMPAPLEYPERLGRWPAAAGIFAFTVLELVHSNPNDPSVVAVAALVYSALTFVAMALFGVERWVERGEAFSVYFNFFSRLSPFERRDGELGLRRPLAGLAQLAPMPGTVALVAVMIGTVTFDGLRDSPEWTDVGGELINGLIDLGLSAQRAFEAAHFVGITTAVLVIYALYRLGIAGVRSMGGDPGTGRLADVFVHSLVPIALAYVAAHYLTLLIFDGQAIVYLASDPLGDGGDIFGTADRGKDYFLGADPISLMQVGLVVVGHVAGLTLAHDRAVALYDKADRAVRSQYWMLAIMVLFTTLALFLLFRRNV